MSPIHAHEIHDARKVARRQLAKSAIELLPLPLMFVAFTAILYAAHLPLWRFMAAGALLYGGLGGLALAFEARAELPRGLDQDQRDASSKR